MQLRKKLFYTQNCKASLILNWQHFCMNITVWYPFCMLRKHKRMRNADALFILKSTNVSERCWNVCLSISAALCYYAGVLWHLTCNQKIIVVNHLMVAPVQTPPPTPSQPHLHSTHTLMETRLNIYLKFFLYALVASKVALCHGLWEICRPGCFTDNYRFSMLR